MIRKQGADRLGKLTLAFRSCLTTFPTPNEEFA